MFGLVFEIKTQKPNQTLKSHQINNTYSVSTHVKHATQGVIAFRLIAFRQIAPPVGSTAEPQPKLN